MLISYKNANIYQRHGICVLKNVNFLVDEGQFIYLIGRVGSGKTTLMRTLYCELELDEADEANVLGYDLLTIRNKDIPALRREMGVVFQDFQLLADRTVYKNLEFVLRATGWKKKDGIEERINEVLEAVGMADKAQQMPFELSGGEQQRVAIARAILNKPKLILADEPTGNLDPETSKEIIELLFRIAGEGTAIVMSTHNLPLIEANPSVTYRCQNTQMEDVTNDFHHLIMVDDTPDTDEIRVRYSEREEI
ncbi:MAG: ATP-binding cassette domain-containing protein [Prevotella sp.]|nr:ATP-binding cassette domain-containing protein [Prevotella sp.]